MNQTGSDWMKYIPLFLYSFRWNIETSDYEQKTFWSFCSYMVRSCKGIEMLVNLINISYCAMKLLPYQDKTFSGELVLLVLFVIRGRFVPRCRSMPSLVPEGVFIGGEKNQSMLFANPVLHTCRSLLSIPWSVAWTHVFQDRK